MNRRVFMASLAALFSSRLFGKSAEAADNPWVFPVNSNRNVSLTPVDQFSSFSLAEQGYCYQGRFIENTGYLGGGRGNVKVTGRLRLEFTPEQIERDRRFHDEARALLAQAS